MNKSHIKVYLTKDLPLTTRLQLLQTFWRHPSIDHIQVSLEEYYKSRDLGAIAQAALKQRYQKTRKTWDLPKQEDPGD